MSSGSAPMFPFPEEPAVNAVTDGGTQPSGYPLMTSVPSRDPALTSPFQPNPASGGFQPKHWAIVSVLAVIVILVAVLSATIFGRESTTVAAEDPSTATPSEVTVDAAPAIEDTTPPPAVAPRPATEVALRVSAPITQPSCDGSGIVVLGSAVVPGKYDSEIQRLLNAHPGAFYLRTDHACPSLRQVSDAGTPIYAVYRPGGRTQGEVCSSVRAAGGDAYGKWLDMTTDPTFMLPC